MAWRKFSRLEFVGDFGKNLDLRYKIGQNKAKAVTNLIVNLFISMFRPLMITRPLAILAIVAVCASCTTIRLGSDLQPPTAEHALDSAVEALEDVDWPSPESGGSVIGSIASVLIRGRTESQEVPPTRAAAIGFIDDKRDDGETFELIWRETVALSRRSLDAGQAIVAASRADSDAESEDAAAAVRLLETAIVRLREHRDIFSAIGDELAARGAVVSGSEREATIQAFADTAAAIGGAADALVAARSPEENRL